MKKFYLIAMMAVAALTVSAQQVLHLSSYNGTNLEPYDGKECKVDINRYVFHGWNTMAMPFAVSEDQLNEVFGSDCKLEKLVGVESSGNGICLYFQDCKALGMEPNVPYILYYTGENANKRLAATTTIESQPVSLNYTTKDGRMVTMSGAQSKIDGIGLYGVLARDNSEARFVAVDETTNGFYATRCFIKVSDGTNTQLTTLHIGANEISAINGIVSGNERVDVYTISGIKVASGVSAAEISKLQAGVYVINGQKVLVR